MTLTLDWQQPNNTEGTAWERLRSGPTCVDAGYLPFAWASWIDALHRGLAPADHPPASPLSGLRATVCQHIWALDHLSAFASAGITDLFWSHATRTMHHRGGIRLHPFPLFPVRCDDHPSPAPPLDAHQRPLLYSYQGFHQRELYLKDTRRWLLALPPRHDACLEARQEWHFEHQVYRQQVHGLPPDPMGMVAVRRQADDYARRLQSSCFALCPSGAGPNSIRLWEALGYGAIPVILSDDLRLPGPSQLWDDAALFVPEQPAEVAALPARLEALRLDTGALLRRQKAGRLLWSLYGLPGFVSDVRSFLSAPDAFLLQQAHARLRFRLGAQAAGPAAFATVELHQADPAQLPLQIRRWRRSVQHPVALVLQLRDRRPLPEQWIHWRVAVSLCRRLLAEDPPVPWTLCSRHPELEALAEAPAA